MFEQIAPLQIDSATSETDSQRLRRLFWVDAIASAAGTFVGMGTFFFTEHRFGWGMTDNFKLAAIQGTLYVVGSLLADHLSGRFGRRNLLIVIYSCLAAIALMAGLFISPARPWLVLVISPLYMFTIGLTWPALETLVASGADAGEMSRRLGKYNSIWAATAAVTLAINGMVIKVWPNGLFFLPVIFHLMCVGIMLSLRKTDTPTSAAEHAQAEAQLQEKRRLALVLSRIALPAGYMVIHALSAMLPLLPVMKQLPLGMRTLAGSMWLATRWGTFVVLGNTTRWHTRPMLLLWAAAAMLMAFVGATVRVGDVITGVGHHLAFDLAVMLAFQAVLGVVLGIIYSASLYFGMVLSDSSTAHAGYHEALIGMGSVMGPLAGLVGMKLSGGSVWWGIGAVAGAIAASVLAAGGSAAVIASRRR